MGRSFLFTSESVSEGHPDKICDQISDAILDHYIKINPKVRTAIECMVTGSKLIIAGEIGGVKFDNAEIAQIARAVIKKIGYEQEKFHWNKIDIELLVIQQSTDIAIGVTGQEGKAEGAGDQGIMFGFACKDTPNFMPAPIYYAHRILKNIADARHEGKLPLLGPDAKSQVTLQYENSIPIGAKTIVVSTQHSAGVTQEQVRAMIWPYVVAAFPEPCWMCAEDQFLVNPTGSFIIGGPESDTGLTGRKIIVDTYGGASPHGGGAFSGKDPSKVDRSAAYMMRYLAKNIVAAGLAEKCTLQISYAIGLARPLSLFVNTHSSSFMDPVIIADRIMEIVDLSPRGIRNHLELDRPIYQPTATYGHFGHEPTTSGHYSWENLDLIESLRKII